MISLVLAQRITEAMHHGAHVVRAQGRQGGHGKGC